MLPLLAQKVFDSCLVRLEIQELIPARLERGILALQQAQFPQAPHGVHRDAQCSSEFPGREVAAGAQAILAVPQAIVVQDTEDAPCSVGPFLPATAVQPLELGGNLRRGVSRGSAFDRLQRLGLGFTQLRDGAQERDGDGADGVAVQAHLNTALVLGARQRDVLNDRAEDALAVGGLRAGGVPGRVLIFGIDR